MGKRGGSKKRKLLKLKHAFDEGRKTIGKLSYKEKLLFLSALYWAEGTKKDFALSNTDPDLIRVFVCLVKEILGVNDDRFRISIRLYEDLDQNKSLSFWSKVVNMPKEKFVNINILPGKKNGKLQYGMCRVRITNGGDLLKRIMGVNKAVVELFSAPIA